LRAYPSIGEPYQAPHIGADCPVLALSKAGANVGRVGIA
jgi:hypothetical protein